MNKKLNQEMTDMSSTEIRFYEDDRKIDVHNNNHYNRTAFHRRGSYRCHIFLMCFNVIVLVYLYNTCGGEITFLYNKLAGNYVSDELHDVNKERLEVYGYRFQEDGKEISSFVKVLDN